MPGKKSSRAGGLSAEITPSLHRLLGAYLEPAGDVHAAALKRYRADGNAADLQRLSDHFAPLAFIEAFKLKRRNPELFSEPLCDYISDGLLGLIVGILRCGASDWPLFCWKMRGYVRRQIWNEMRSRSWGGRRRAEGLSALAKIRAELTRELGCVPTREQIAARLGGQIINPQLYIALDDDGVQAIPSSQLGDDENHDIMQRLDAHSNDLSRNMLDQEMINLALKGLKGIDRKILRLMLGGEGPSEIARKLGLPVSTIYQRLNGVLWMTRCNAALADYVGVEADARPQQPNRSGHMPKFNPTPAKLAAGIHERSQVRAAG